jgi:CheY-like chemotaxis protein
MPETDAARGPARGARAAIRHRGGITIMRTDYDPNGEGWDDRPILRWPGPPRIRVLVAEDDPHLREMVATRLRREGYDVLDVGSGDEALALMKVIAEHELDDLELVIMDVRMPGMSGLDVVHTLRAWHWDTPVLLITAYPEPHVIAEAKQLGVTMLAKPFAFPRLSLAAMEAMRTQGGEP